jgi:hypothetical protein
LGAIRGGEAIFAILDAASALAKLLGEESLLIYVVDVGFLDRTERAFRPDTVMVEMRREVA